MRNTAESTVTDVLTGPEGFRPDQNYIGAGRTATVLFHLLLGGLAVVLFAGLANLLRSQQEDTLSQTMITSHLDEKGQLRPLAEVIEITRSLKLITVVVDSTVQAKTSVDTWRGDVSAVVEAPVRYVYGVDLSRLEPDAFRAGKILGGYDIVVPQPERVAVEVDGSNPTKEEVNVTGTRFRT
ncbi:MAG: hypothetical protein KDA65_13220, partial [Planctomycetaceae bacterium]|nr:hypothetical protein [Planctomycetaceae bacterium]